MSCKAGTAKLFFREAICRAVADEMHGDPRVIVLGQDVGAFGGSYKEFAGLMNALAATAFATPRFARVA